MKIGIIGLGLIGGSIFKRLIQDGFDVVGISQSQIGKNIFKDFSILTSCDVVFVCTPMSKTIETLDKISGVVPQNALVTDVCSLKSFILNKEYPFMFIPSHPMAGTEFSGYENSNPQMFEGAKWVITPLDSNTKSEILESLILSMGATPIYTTPELHDEAVAMISHAPLVLAQALFKTAEKNNLAMHLASSGFRDSTRLAGSNPEMAIDMLSLNKENIVKSLLEIHETVNTLLTNYDKELVTELSNKRKAMYIEGKNTFKV